MAKDNDQRYKMIQYNERTAELVCERQYPETSRNICKTHSLKYLFFFFILLAQAKKC